MAGRNGRAQHRHRTRESLDGGFHAMDGIKGPCRETRSAECFRVAVPTSQCRGRG